jgi:ATP-binding protein involved in chromosome partitioning
MRIAVPTAAGTLCPHFGHCETFAIIDIDDNRRITGERQAQPPAHEPGALPRWLQQEGVNVVIAGGMGMRAQQLFQQAGIEVVVGAPGEPAKNVAMAWLQGALKQGDNLCDH